MRAVGGMIDLAVVAVLALAVLRGLWIGMVREAFSLAALATAVIAFRSLREPVAAEIAARTQWDPLIATAAAGGVVVVAAILFVTIVGAIVRRLVGVAGLSALDRLGGAAVGAAEGLLLVALALFGATEVLGPRDPFFEGSRAVATFQAWRGTGDARLQRDAASRSAATPAPPNGRGGGSAR
jgi:membrane protein required for colicin V production